MPKRGKKKVRKAKFYKKSLKITEKQHKLLRQFCKHYDVTENKVFRRALKEFLSRNTHDFDHHYQVSPNQLSLFDISEEEKTM